MNDAIARARANVALAKYWGKRVPALNLPYTGSISVTLAGLETTVHMEPSSRAVDGVTFSRDSAGTTSHIAAPPAEAANVSRFLDLVRRLAESDARAEIDISSNFPAAAGLASSASTYAALAVAATRAFGLDLGEAELSALARRGSGSAARSLQGGFVEWLAGTAADGNDSHGVQLAGEDHWALGIVVAVTEEGPKKVSSRAGMELAAEGSPFFPAWLETHPADAEAIRRGIAERDLALVGETAEHNCLKMHATCLAARPPILYWTPATLAVLLRVHAMRAEGVTAYFTIDAGPQVKVLCRIEDRPTVAEQLARVPGVHRVLLSAPGPGAEVLSPP